jgi:hypothetical protein
MHNRPTRPLWRRRKWSGRTWCGSLRPAESRCRGCREGSLRSQRGQTRRPPRRRRKPPSQQPGWRRRRSCGLRRVGLGQVRVSGRHLPHPARRVRRRLVCWTALGIAGAAPASGEAPVARRSSGWWARLLLRLLRHSLRSAPHERRARSSWLAIDLPSRCGGTTSGPLWRLLMLVAVTRRSLTQASGLACVCAAVLLDEPRDGYCKRASAEPAGPLQAIVRSARCSFRALSPKCAVV